MSIAYNLPKIIDSSNADILFNKIIKVTQDNVAELDAKELTYISGDGLRAVLMLYNKQKKLIISNVSEDIYDILESSGLSQFVDVIKKPRFLSIKGLKYICNGLISSIYEIDKNYLVKVFPNDTPPSIVLSEKANSVQAFLNGIRTAFSFDVVETEDGLGIIYEKLNSESLIDLISGDHAKSTSYIRQFASFLRETHKTELDIEKFDNVVKYSLEVLPALVEAGIITNTESERLFDFYSSIPYRTTFVHGDCHPGNIKFSGSDMMFIDMSDCGYGHPIFDLLSMNTVYYLGPHNGIPIFPEQLGAGFSNEEALNMWYEFIGEYFQTNDREFLENISLQVEALAAARMLCVSLNRHLFTDNFIQMLKRIFNTYYLEMRKPILF